jgi:hypothetical protein
MEEYTVFATETNYANTLTRRREAYHDTALEHRSETAGGEGGTPSIHDIEGGLHLDQRPPLDAEDRALLVDRVLPGDLKLHQYASGDYWPRQSWARTSFKSRIESEPEAIQIVCEGTAISKRLRFSTDGSVTVSYSWDRSLGQTGDRFTTELSLFSPLELRADSATDTWTFAIETVAKSERGFDRTRQGQSVTFLWPVELGAAMLELQVPTAARLAGVEAGLEVDG